MDDQLRQQGIVEMGHFIARAEAEVEADAGSVRLDVLQELAGARQESVRGVFGVDAALDGMSALCRSGIAETGRARLPRRGSASGRGRAQ